MNRMPRGTVSSGSSVLRRETMAGTALIHVIDRRPMRSQKPLRWNRSSRTRLEPATNADSSPTTSALMWNSGSGLKPRSSESELQVRRHAARRVEQLAPGPTGPLWASPSCPTRTARHPRRRHAGAPSLPAGSRARPPGGSRRSSSIHSPSTPAGAGGPPARRPRRCATRATARPPPPLDRHGRVERATQKPALTAPGRRPRTPRVADDEADCGQATGPEPAEQGPPPVHALLQLTEGQRMPSSRACSR